MIQRTEMRKLKKSLTLTASRQRYHNKNKTGGNFGYDLHPTDRENYPYPWMDLNGTYDTEGNLRLLSVTYQNIGKTRIQLINHENYQTVTYNEIVESLQMFLKVGMEEFPC